MAKKLEIPGRPEAAKVPTRLVSAELKRLMAMTHTLDECGDPVTLAQVFARRLIDMALGWTEFRVDDRGIKTSVRHDPESWAFVAVLDRYEGKPKAAEDEETPRLEADARVMSLVRDRLNAMAKSKEGSTDDLNDNGAEVPASDNSDTDV